MTALGGEAVMLQHRWDPLSPAEFGSITSRGEDGKQGAYWRTPKRVKIPINESIE
jgi:hypothetical protein